MMGKKPPGVLVFLLVLLKVLGTAEADCSSTCSPSCDCRSQGLTSVPQDLPTTITELDLRQNQITTLSQSDFSRYRGLRKLYISSNNISTINSQTFYHLSNLVRLELNQNRLTNLRSDMFTGLGNLEWLRLSNNEITDIQAGTFTSMTRLKNLYMQQNKLNLRSDMFTGLGNLETLLLENNDISDIQAGTFNPTPQLTNLLLSYNKLTTLKADMFTGLGNLEGLSLHSNEITVIQAGTFNLPTQLIILNMGGNKLTNLRPDMFTGLGNLVMLLLDNNEITDIQAGTFNPTSQLRYLDLFNNKLTNLRPDMFTGPGNLEGLSLHSNNISDIQAGTFNPTPQLRDLWLHNNHIQSIPCNLLANLLQLEELILFDNNITTFPFEDLSIQTLSRLYLHNNQMTTLPSTAYGVLSSISDVNIDNNPWQCDCRMVDFRLKMTGSYPFENQITCSQPDHLHGQKLVNISPEDVDNCESPTIVRFETISNNTLVLPGNTLTLVCEGSGIPTPEITVILPSGLNVTVGSVGRVIVEYGTVIVRNFTADDAGLYVCIAANFVGSTFATLSIDLISDEPTIMRFEMVNSDPLVQGETLIFVCQPSGVPTPDITVILPSGLNATVEAVGRVTVYANGTVIVRDITAADAGLYVCIAANSIGSKFATLYVDINLKVTTVATASSSLALTGTSCKPETNSYLATAPTFSLPVLLGAICGSIAGTVIIGGIILAIWCKRNNQSPPKGPDFSVVFNNTNTTTTVITNGHDLTGQTQTSNVRTPQLVPRPASSQFQPYEDVQPPPGGAVPRQPASRQALQPPNRSNNEPPPLPPPRTASATGYENIPEHAYQPLTTTRNQPDNGQDSSHHYQSLRRT